MTLTEAIRASLNLLDRRDRRLLGLAVLAQTATSVLDLAGVAMLGLVGAVAVSIIGGNPPPMVVGQVISALGLGGLPPKTLVAVLVCLGALLLLIKSVLSPILMARVLRFLARREAMVSARLTADLLSRPITFIQRRSTQKTALALNTGTNSAIAVVLGQTAAATAEMALLAALATALLVVNPPVALGAIAFFALVGVGLHRTLGHRSAQFAARRRRADLASLVTVQEALGNYRQIIVTNRRHFYVERMQNLRTEAAEAAAGTQLVSMLPKYLSEAALVLGSCVLAGVLFATEPVDVATGTVALFLAAATRVMPSLLRLQSAALGIRSASATAEPTFSLAEDLQRSAPRAQAASLADHSPAGDAHYDFTPSIQLRDVTFAYPGVDSSAVRRITLDIRAGQSVALVGRSGSGKSTLADVILGVLEPDDGMVSVGGLPPGFAVSRWPGGISYVPQDVMLVNDSVRNNVALGLQRNLIDDELVWDALRRAHLADFFSRQPNSLDLQIGERGLRLSGGQRQRLGIARALFTQPRLIVLDEATSSLDAETEKAITETFNELQHDVTTVVIAHRLSTVRHADLVVYLQDGVIAAAGTFDDVCTQVPALRRQAELMGLHTQPWTDST
jgi:ABC-type multidrug transport system fused ATPase/permease subunit